MFTYYFQIVIIFQQLDLKWNSQNRLITSTSFIISSVFMYKLQYLGLKKIAVKKFYLTICWLIKTEQEIHQGTLSTTTETSLKKVVNVKNKFLWSLWPRNKVSDQSTYNGNNFTRIHWNVHMLQYRYLFKVYDK